MRRYLILGVILATGLTSAACATRPLGHVADAMPGQAEAIYAAAFTRDTILLKVSSNGCTDKADIKPFITQLRSHAVMTLRRLEEDTCDNARKDGVMLQWSFDELGLAPGTQVEVDTPYTSPRDAS